jgi:hypothetical protein
MYPLSSIDAVRASAFYGKGGEPLEDNRPGGNPAHRGRSRRPPAEAAATAP